MRPRLLSEGSLTLPSPRALPELKKIDPLPGKASPSPVKKISYLDSASRFIGRNISYIVPAVVLGGTLIYAGSRYLQDPQKYMERVQQIVEPLIMGMGEITELIAQPFLNMWNSYQHSSSFMNSGGENKLALLIKEQRENFSSFVRGEGLAVRNDYSESFPTHFIRTFFSNASGSLSFPLLYQAFRFAYSDREFPNEICRRWSNGMCENINDLPKKLENEPIERIRNLVLQEDQVRKRALQRPIPYVTGGRIFSEKDQDRVSYTNRYLTPDLREELRHLYPGRTTSQMALQNGKLRLKVTGRVDDLGIYSSLQMVCQKVKDTAVQCLFQFQHLLGRTTYRVTEEIGNDASQITEELIISSWNNPEIRKNCTYPAKGEEIPTFFFQLNDAQARGVFAQPPLSNAEDKERPLEIPVEALCTTLQSYPNPK